MQKDLFDWILTDEKNVFRNKKTNELIFSLAAKRGNKAYTAKKNQKLNEILAAVADGQFDTPVPGMRSDNYRLTKVLLATLTFSHKRYTPEQAWGLLRASDLDDHKFEHGVLNKFGANISSTFGSNGKLTCKEASSNGYPAPHVIIVLDKPVLVKRHIGKDGETSWRIADKHILTRIGKDAASRARSRIDVEAAIENNPIWTYGTLDVKGIVKEDRFKKFSNGFTYVFKYLIKTISIDKYPELAEQDTINESKNPSLRTMMFTHMGNKCFRTRDIVFGKAFKDRIGLLPEDKEEVESEWERIKTMPAWLADLYVKEMENKKKGADTG